MKGHIYFYPMLIKEAYLDAFGHVNNAIYLSLFEEARWDIITKNGYGLHKIIEAGKGYTILEIKIRFLRELKLRDEIVIESQFIAYEGKFGLLKQRMLRKDEECCVAELTTALFDLKERKLIAPTAEWLKAIGIEA